MRAARRPRRRTGATRLLVLKNGHPESSVLHSRVRALGELLEPSDLLVVNRSGTAPASLHGRVRRTGETLELRLASFLGPSIRELKAWSGILFGAGDWTDATEARGTPPLVERGDRLIFDAGLSALVTNVDRAFSRLVRVELEATNIPNAIHRHGSPIQYSYLKDELRIDEQQTLFAGPAVSVEAPSAAFPLTWQQLMQLKRAGIELAALTHSAGISSTGDAGLDRRLPLPEWFDMPASTAHAIREAKAHARRVVALGTSVVRAIESSISATGVAAQSGVTRLKLGPSRPPQVVDALITGIHDDGTSHLELLRAFCDSTLLERGYAEAEALGYRGHEYGDLALIG